MGSIGELKQSIIQVLSGLSAFAGVEWLEEFPTARKSVPLESPLVVVGLWEAGLGPSGLGGFLGNGGQEGRGQYGQWADLTFYFDIHTPPAQGGSACHRLYEALCEALLLGGSAFGFTRLWCDGVGGDKTAHSNRLRVWGTLRGALSAEDRSGLIGEFSVQYEPGQGGAL